MKGDALPYEVMHLTGDVMATTKPRITITLSEEQHALLHKLADVQKVSMSSIVVELLDTAIPVLERLTSILETAAQAPQTVLDELRKSLQVAEGDMNDAQSQVFGQLDLLEAVAAGAVRSAAPAVTASSKALKTARPPSTNRGVRIPPSKSLKARPGAASKLVGKGKKK